MKAILEFNLPEDREDFETCQKAVNYKIALQDFYQESLRKRNKYSYTEKTTDELLKALIDEYIELTKELDL